MSIIGVSGSQGQGKSTTIKGVIEKSDKVRYLNAQTARETLADWGYALSEVNAYMPLKIKYQEELLRRHSYTLDQVAGDDESDVFLVERTFADIFTYALVSVGPFNNYSKWLNDYYQRCKLAQQLFFDEVVFLSGRKYTPEKDGVRSTNDHFSKLVDYLIEFYIQDFFAGREENITYINIPGLEDRIEIILELCDEKKRHNNL